MHFIMYNNIVNGDCASLNHERDSPYLSENAILSSQSPEAIIAEFKNVSLQFSLLYVQWVL